jgi:hypothetical protein
MVEFTKTNHEPYRYLERNITEQIQALTAERPGQGLSKICRAEIQSCLDANGGHIQHATTCFSCSPPDVNLVANHFRVCICVK